MAIDMNHVRWCSQLWSLMADNGRWGLPNSGLVFRKDATARELVLVDVMPYDPSMPLTAAELKARQISLYIDTIEHFALIGVKVRRDCEWPVQEE